MFPILQSLIYNNSQDNVEFGLFIFNITILFPIVYGKFVSSIYILKSEMLKIVHIANACD